MVFSIVNSVTDVTLEFITTNEPLITELVEAMNDVDELGNMRRSPHTSNC